MPAQQRPEPRAEADEHDDAQEHNADGAGHRQEDGVEGLIGTALEQYD